VGAVAAGLEWLGPRGRDGGVDTVPLPSSVGGLSLCGKHAIGPDWAAAMVRCGASTVVCLVEAHELDDRYPDYVEWLRGNDGGCAVWFPIHDLHAPDLDKALALLGNLSARLAVGEHLLVHCGAGIGRAGTIATCLLIELGMGADAALAHVAAHRPMAGPEVGAQRDLVAALAERRR
jgi:protein-tyrosine phosphatase